MKKILSILCLLLVVCSCSAIEPEPEPIGFGISTPEQAAKISKFSDGVIVGSAIIKIVEKYGKEAPKYVGEYVKSMTDAIK